MASAKTYIETIRKQVKADNGGKVPEHLDLTIRNYAAALATRDMYRETIERNQSGAVVYENGILKQHPLCGLLYQQELLCLNYAKALGATSAKAASKTDHANNDTDKLGDLLEDTNNVK